MKLHFVKAPCFKNCTQMLEWACQLAAQGAYSAATEWRTMQRARSRARVPALKTVFVFWGGDDGGPVLGRGVTSVPSRASCRGDALPLDLALTTLAPTKPELPKLSS